MKWFLCMSTLVIILIISSCDFPGPSQPIERSDLFGRYIGDFGKTDINYFDLYEDSTYISYYKTEDGHLDVDTGFWRFVTRRDKTSVDYWLDMYDFQPGHPSSGTTFEEDDKSRTTPSDDLRVSRFNLTKRSYEIEVEYSFRKQQYYIKKLEINEKQ